MCLVEFLSPGRFVTDTFIVSCTTRNLDMLHKHTSEHFWKPFGIWKYTENFSSARTKWTRYGTSSNNCQQHLQQFCPKMPTLISLKSTSWGQKVLLVFFAFSSIKSPRFCLEWHPASRSDQSLKPIKDR